MDYKSGIFTKRSKITKSAQLELVPYGKTKDTIEKKEYLRKDIEKAEMADSFKKYIQMYILEGVNDALSHFEFDYASIAEKKETDEKDYASALDKFNEVVAAHIKEYLSPTAKGYPVKLGNEKWLFEMLPDYIEKKGYPEDAQALRDMKGTLPLFKRMFTTCKTMMETWTPARVVENLEIYLGNMAIVKRIKESEHTEFISLYEDELDVYSSADGFGECLTTDGIAGYNRFISGTITEKGIETIGYNMFANEQNNLIRTKNLSEPYYKKAKKLRKQIFAPQEKMFEIERIESNEELITVCSKNIEEVTPICDEMNQFFKSITDAQEYTYISGINLHALSHIVYNRHNAIPDILAEKMEDEINRSEMKPGQKKKAVNEIKNTINKSYYNIKELSDITRKNIAGSITDKSVSLYETVELCRKRIENSDIYKCQMIKENRKYVALIRKYVNAVTDYRMFAMIFNGNDMENTAFVNEKAMDFAEKLKVSSKAEDMMRNYITSSLKKEAVKTRLFFDTTQKLTASWWNQDSNNNHGKFHKGKNTILLKGGKYYFFTLADDTKPVAFDEPKDEDDLIKIYSCNKAVNPVLSVPKFAFPKSVKTFFESSGQNTFVLKESMAEPVVITREQYEIYRSGSFKKEAVTKLGITEEEQKKNCTKLLYLYKKIINNHVMWKDFDFSSLKEPEEYDSAGEFLMEVDAKAIRMKWVEGSKKQVEELVENGQALMFEIRNRNMYSNRKKTSYAEIFLAIFSEENMADTNICLNAAPDIYFRPAIKEPVVAHPKGSQLVCKKDINGEYVPENIYHELYHYHNGRLSEAELSEEALKWKDRVKHREAPFDMIRNERYTKDKYILSFSYTLNKQVEKDTSYDINEDVNEIVEESGNIVSVTRGVDHLLYYVVTDKNNNIIEQGDLDKLGDTDYMKKLKQINKQRDLDKQNWIYDTKVADIKDFYITHAVDAIIKLALQYNALIVVDKIDEKVKNRWAFLDNQVFGKFEEALCNRLSCYTIRNTDAGKPGSFINPLQLSYSSKGWRKGIVYAQSPGYTRNVDPDTGFVNLFILNDLGSATKKRNFLKKFDSITYTGDAFRFKFDYSNFETSIDMPERKWVISVSGERTVYNKEKRKTEYIENVAEHLADVIKKDIPLVKETEIPVDDLSNKSIESMMNCFINVLYGNLSKCDEIKETCTVSPITGKRINSTANAAIMQGKKYRFFQEYKKRTGNEKQPAEEWLNSLIQIA